MRELIHDYLQNWGAADPFAMAGAWIILAIGVIVCCFLVNFIAKTYLLRILSYAIKKTKTKWDDALMKRRVFNRLSHLAPAIVLYFSAPLFPELNDIIQKFSFIYMLAVGIAVMDSFLSAVVDIYHTTKYSRDKPVKGYIQVLKIFMYIAGSIFIIATLVNRSPWGLISGLGAMTAIIMLIFKDSLLGLVASIQMSAYDMVRTGDWITMPKHGVDGDVLDVSLNTIKVQNFDKTIVTIPTYMLISESVQNWRGMQDSGGRRIKRCVFIDMNTIQFCNKSMLNKFKKYHLLKDHIDHKEKELAEFNELHNIDNSELVNGRRLTNVGCFRAYITSYLRNHPKIHQDLTFLIRHLEPTEKGLPIQIYVFTNDTIWAHYEDIQADIFDHILAVVPEFELRVYQNPSGKDVQALGKGLKAA